MTGRERFWMFWKAGKGRFRRKSGRICVLMGFGWLKLAKHGRSFDIPSQDYVYSTFSHACNKPIVTSSIAIALGESALNRYVIHTNIIWTRHSDNINTSSSCDSAGFEELQDHTIESSTSVSPQ